MDPLRLAALKDSYDRVADEYVARIYDELDKKPLDRQLLDRLAAQCIPIGPILDVGCGPGQIARYLHDRGAPVSGLDLSSEMVARARTLNPSIPFQQGDMRALPVPDASLGGIAAFYSILHIPRDEVVATLIDFRRALRPGGLALIAFHIGDEAVHLQEWWGHSVSVDFMFFRSSEMAEYLRAAGLILVETSEREPYPEVEHPSRRAYLFATKP